MIVGDQKGIRCVIMRGGTTKGVFLHARDLPVDPQERQKVILELFGSPDPRQIDGLGGADSLSSRVAIISPSNRAGIDVEYTFGFVHIAEPLVEFRGTCGNMMSGVAPFAIDEGLVPIQEPVTRVNIYDTNTRMHILAEVPVVNGKAQTQGDCKIAGVAHSGGRITLNFMNCAGATTGKLIPTGQLAQMMEGYEVSIIDAVNPNVFLKASALGLKGDETADELSRDKALLAKLEKLREAAGALLGLKPSAMIPKIAFVAPPPHPHCTLSARMLTLGKIHNAYAVSIGVCTAIAAQIPGTVVHEAAKLDASPNVKVSHPSGIMEITAVVKEKNGVFHVEKAAIERTARRLMEGIGYIRL